MPKLTSLNVLLVQEISSHRCKARRKAGSTNKVKGIAPASKGGSYAGRLNIL